jgi:hypothetical protein
MSKNIKNIGEVIAEISHFGNVAVPAGIIEFQKILVQKLHQLILTKTPIDKGVLRGNWLLTIDSVDESYDENKKTSAESTGAVITSEEAADVERVLEELTVAGLGHTVHLSNSTHYALKAEIDGWGPNTPPYAMVALSLQEIYTSIGAARKEFEQTVKSLQSNVKVKYAANV